MLITIKESLNEDGDHAVTVVNAAAVTATDAAWLWVQAMLGFGYHKESVIDAMHTVLEEYESE